MNYIIFSFLLCYVLWIFYLAVMNLRRVRDTVGLSKTAVVLGYPLLFVGYALDFLANVFVVSVILLELPRETTVTARLSRHIKEDTWRSTVSQWVGDNLLNAFDPSGNHLG